MTTIDAGILAGGLSRRMNGNDKGLQLFHHKPMVSYAIDAVRSHVNKVLISCNQNLPEYQSLGYPLCEDIIPGYLGPLAGIYSLLDKSKADYLMILPCDTPKVGERYIKKMLEELAIRQSSDPDSAHLFAAYSNNKHHPLHLCISQQYKLSIVEALNKGELKVMRWLESHNVEWIDFSDANVNFSNLNTLDCLNKAN